MLIVDSHCHLDRLDLTPYEGSLAAALAAANEHAVNYFLCVCIDMENFSQVQSIAQQFDNVFASVGLHPNEQDVYEPSIDELVACTQHPKVVAIGETGLDYFRTEDSTDWQQERFRRHIRAAREAQLPLIIHTRDANADTLRILREERAHEVGGVFHCFTGSWEMAQQGIDLGFMISFSGIITFKNARELQSVVQQVPLDKMLIETDAPYLAPVPYRGKSNEPAYVRFVAQQVADLRAISYEQVAQQTTTNFFNLFTKTRQA
ncbi:MAG: TatD family hydrolase [Gammaproteobacteria bacterium]